MTEMLREAFLNLDDEAALAGVRTSLEAGRDPVEIIEECRQGITEVGERFGCGEFYLSELIMAADIFQRSMELVEPHLETVSVGPARGTIVIGTVKGDIHDLGKNIVAVLLRCEGFEVVDLGVDVPAERFVEALVDTGARIVGLSCLMTTAFESMKLTVEAIAEAGLRQGIYVMVGGGPVDGRVCEYVGADLFAQDAVAGVRASTHFLGS
jgi:methylmalonyl-CoA mutase cobalamin-binding domain/chain